MPSARHLRSSAWRSLGTIHFKEQSHDRAQKPNAGRLIALAVSSLLGACVVAPVPPPYPGGGAVIVAPPPVVESYGVPPAPGNIWISGYWNWSGDRHVWNRGHWERNRPGYRWAPHRWHRDGRGWRDEPGRWERRR